MNSAARILACSLILACSTANADELTLHIFKSPLGINWKTPWKLSTSTLANQVAPVGRKRAFSISHVFVEIKCESLDRHIYRGMTSLTDTEERELLFRKKYGLGVMFHTYQGLYEKDESILKDMIPYKGNRRYGQLSYKISPSTCERLLAYADEYEALGYGTMYSGLQADPLKREGAGCSAFAVSFLRVGGLMSDYSSEWKQSIHVPKRLIGGPLTNNRVSLQKILSRPRARWNSKEPHIYLEAWDPEKMHSWVRRIYQQVSNGRFQAEDIPEISHEGRSLKIIFDYQHRPTPEGPFWLD
jgi:hypothetical protein